MNEDLESLFQKKFSFEKDEEWILPPTSVLYKSKLWDISTLQTLKLKLNDTKSLLNDKGEAWHNHTSNINKAGLIQNHIKRFLKPEFVTNAWCKFYEILATFSCISPGDELFRSLHLCEAPGAFVSALNYYLCLNCPSLEWEWFANTLNPYYEGHPSKICVTDDRLIFYTLKHWLFGKSNTGDITSESVIKEISEVLRSKGLVNLVTADGSVNCIDNPGEQELIVSDLHFAELLVCLNTLAPGGNFILKKFTCFECSSICILYLLNCLFHEVHVFKPVTSRSGNSEIYVICLNFYGIEFSYLDALRKSTSLKNFSLFPQLHIPFSFIKQLEECCKFFVDHQISSILNNLDLFASMNQEQRQDIDELRDACLSKYFEVYCLEPLATDQYYRLFSPNKILRTANTISLGRRRIFTDKSFNLTYENIEHRRNSSKEEILQDLENILNKHFPISTKRSIDDNPSFIPIWKEMRSIFKKTDYKNWITLGQPVQLVKNSKFVNPAILSLLNEVIYDMKILPQHHTFTTNDCWRWQDLIDISGTKEHLLSEDVIIHMGISSQKSFIAASLLPMLSSHIKLYNCDTNSLPDEEILKTKKLVVIDPSTWGPPTFRVEIAYQQEFVTILLNALKVLYPGDSMVLHFQSLYTRFQVGLLFMVLALFEKTYVLLPESHAPALCGQVWVLYNCIHEQHIKVISQYLKSVLQTEVTDDVSVLEIVPVTMICSGQFYDYLLSLNNSYTLQKLRKLIAVEKCIRV